MLGKRSPPAGALRPDESKTVNGSPVPSIKENMMNTSRRILKRKAWKVLGTLFRWAGDGLWEIRLRRAAGWCWEQSGYYMARYWYG